MEKQTSPGFSSSTTLLLLCLLNIILKLLCFNIIEVGHDEPFTMTHSQLPVGTIFSELSKGNNPPLFEIILHYWTGLFGESLFAYRSLPAIFSSITVIFLYKIGENFFNREVAIITTLLFTFSTFHFHHSHNIRVYSMFAMLSVASMYYFLALFKESKNLRLLIGLIFVNVVNAYSHFFSIDMILIQILAILLYRELWSRKFLKTYGTHLVIFGACYGPYISYLIFRVVDSYEKKQFVAPYPDGLETVYNIFWIFSNQPLVAGIFLLTIIGGGFYLFAKIINGTAKVDLPLKIILLWFFFPMIYKYFASYFLPMYIPRYLIHISFSYYFIVALIFSHIYWKIKEKHYPVKVGLSFLVFPVLLMILTWQPGNDLYINQRGDKRFFYEYLIK